MNPFRFLRSLFSAVFPPKRRIVRLLRPSWHVTDFMLLECGHQIAIFDYEAVKLGQARCDRCVR